MYCFVRSERACETFQKILPLLQPCAPAEGRPLLHPTCLAGRMDTYMTQIELVMPPRSLSPVQARA